MVFHFLQLISGVSSLLACSRLQDGSAVVHLLKSARGLSREATASFLKSRAYYFRLACFIFATFLPSESLAQPSSLLRSKAFDRVSHVNLSFNLEYLGVKGSLLACFRSYLSGKGHRVVIDNEPSDFLVFTSGVPQVSILGPLLFSNFINDMPKVISRALVPGWDSHIKGAGMLVVSLRLSVSLRVVWAKHHYT